MSAPVADEPLRKFQWLQLSDLHVGMTTQDWLWPTLKRSFFDDLKTLHAKTGGWNTVIFSGDITQSGSREEFDKFDIVTNELWEQFDKLGFTPTLVVLPGNHDVRWPKPLNPTHRVLKKWWEEEEIHDEFFSTPSSPYRLAIRDLLLEYSSWLDRNAAPTGRLVKSVSGLLPGDQSIKFEADGLKIGIVCLNSTWLQIDGDQYLGKLHVDPRQLLAVTNDDPAGWCEPNSLNLLVTHHPTNWLHPESQSLWRSEINPPGRFNAHLFGHMHEPISNSLSTSGSPVAHSIQSPSVFGLLHTKDRTERIHGYLVAKFTKSSNSGELKLWPRRLYPKSSGARAIGPDTAFHLNESDNSYVLFRTTFDDNPAPAPEVMEDDPIIEQSSTSLAVFPGVDTVDQLLNKVRYNIPQLAAHQNIRRVEQQQCLELLTDFRSIWLIAEWGMGDDGFISALRSRRGDQASPAYRLDLTDYTDRTQLFETLKSKLGCSLERFSELLSRVGPSLLLLDNVPITLDVDPGTKTPEADLEEVIGILLEYCPELTVILRALRPPQHHDIPTFELQGLDEADCKTYVADHELGGPQIATPRVVGDLMRLTDGIPARIDQSLRHLEVAPLSELVSLNSDLAATEVTANITPPGLQAAVNDLASASDPFLRRAYGLLRALAIFPQGEQIVRIKRFQPNAPFFANHATELRGRALIEVSSAQRIDSAEPETSERTLIVPRAIRECVRATMTLEELRDLNQRAANLYFGPNWTNGVLKPSTAYRFNNPHCSSADVANANVIIIRLIKDAQLSEDEHAASRAKGLAGLYIKALLSGDHYQSVVTFCDDLLPLISETHYESQHIEIIADFATCLRMIDDDERARDLLLEIVELRSPSYRKQSILLTLCLCYQTLDEIELCKETAQKVIDINKNSNAGLQAKSVLIEVDYDDPKREAKLIALEKTCRRNKADVTANNIALLRAREASDDSDKVREILKTVVQSTGDTKDYYNRIRAIVSLADVSLEAGDPLGERELAHLVGSYHFLFNERLSRLFDQCHESLWKSFDRVKDTDNLLRLFRHSSLYWRLRGSDAQERKYLSKLSHSVGSEGSRKLVSLSREAAYYQIRAHAVSLIEHKK